MRARFISAQLTWTSSRHAQGDACPSRCSSLPMRVKDLCVTLFSARIYNQLLHSSSLTGSIHPPLLPACSVTCSSAHSAAACVLPQQTPSFPAMRLGAPGQLADEGLCEVAGRAVPPLCPCAGGHQPCCAQPGRISTRGHTRCEGGLCEEGKAELPTGELSGC
eukprot:scaffold186883_cov20-Tisochrysis_lutea.AAC.1